MNPARPESLGLGEGKELTIRRGLVLRREAGRVGLKKPALPARSYEKRWDGSGALALAGAGLTLKGSMRKAAAGRRPVKNDERFPGGRDAVKLCFPLTVRNRRPGDLYRPLGAPGRKKLKEILRAKGIPYGGRDRLPVVLSRGEIVWAPGLPIGERYKITDATTAVFSIRVVRGRGRRGSPGP